jgi:hypothetical protein
VVWLGAAGRNEVWHPVSILQTFQHGSKPSTQIDVSSHDDSELQGYGLTQELHTVMERESYGMKASTQASV